MELRMKINVLIIIFSFMSVSSFAENIRDVTKRIVRNVPYQVENCSDRNVSGDKTFDTITGAIIGGAIGNNVTKNVQNGGAVGAIIGGILGNQNSTANTSTMTNTVRVLVLVLLLECGVLATSSAKYAR